MTKIRADQPLVPSVLDRLIDEAPEVKTEPPKARSQVLRELKQSVRRDLENLLNTHKRITLTDEILEELDRSVVAYGVPDIHSAELSSERSRTQFATLLEEVIRKFEPRLQNISVVPLDEADPEDRMLRFRINALLRVEPAPEPVVFDSAIQRVTGNVEVRGAAR
jgi:type VI secretion system protein ImpF